MDIDDHDWPGTAIAFLTDLSENNNRSWFDACKHRYREAVAAPAARCRDELTVLLEGAAGCPMDGRIFRLARDMRFARPDDPPYHPWLRMAFRAPHRATACYLSIEPAGVRFGVGVIAFDKALLTAWRNAVASPAASALAPAEQRLIDAGWRIDPPELRRLPRGLDADGAPARWLRYKQFSAWRHTCGSPFRSRRDLQTWCVAAAEDARPLSDWLGHHLPAADCAGRPRQWSMNVAYDEYLADRIRQQLDQRHQPYQEKRMMGGLCFMVDDKMCMGVSDDRLMVRADPDDYARLLRLPGAGVMNFTGRPLKGFLFVEPAGIDRDEDLSGWVQRCLDYNPKAQRSARRQKKRP